MKKNQIGKEILYLRKWILVTVQLKLFHQILIVSIDVDTDDIKNQLHPLIQVHMSLILAVGQYIKLSSIQQPFFY